MKVSSKAIMLFDFVRFYFKAETIYQQDSPLIYGFCKNVLERYIQVHLPETTRYQKSCLNNTTAINITPIGSQSKLLSTSQTTIQEIAKTASSNISKCKIITAIAKWNNTSTALELGTNLGIMSSALAESGLSVVTVEGNKELFDRNLTHLQSINNLECHSKLFKDFLKQNNTKFDLIFIDGDHSYKSTIDIIDSTKKILKVGGFIILDDIRWSLGMKKVWDEIISCDQFNLCIDLFAFGIVGTKPDLKAPLHKKLIPKKYKPWPYFFFR